MKRILIGGTHSGCGKTTVTCAILQALCHRGLSVASFKCGPDYIDPMFHQTIIGTDSYNLDSFFCNDDTLRSLLWENSQSAELSVIEGVMGFYDGANGKGSAYSVSQITDTPSIIVIDCKGMQDSIGAVMQGFLSYQQPNQIAGFLFNRLPESLIPFVKNLCDKLNTRYFGCLPRTSITIESRHLGLVTAAEVEHLKEKMQALGELAEQHILLDDLLALGERPFPKGVSPVLFPVSCSRPPVIAVAKDRAFCFTYNENLALLKKLGCELKFFSPMKDKHLPEHTCGLLLSGGYPELYAEELSENTAMRQEILQALQTGMPVIAECGGFLYLHRTLQTKDGAAFPMVGWIDGEAFPTERLQRFGYIAMTAQQDTLFCNAGETIKGHEFHYWDSTACGEAFLAKKTNGKSWYCGHSTKTSYAGFPHFYFYANTHMAERFVQQCAEYGGC